MRKGSGPGSNSAVSSPTGFPQPEFPLTPEKQHSHFQWVSTSCHTLSYPLLKRHLLLLYLLTFYKNLSGRSKLSGEFGS